MVLSLACAACCDSCDNCPTVPWENESLSAFDGGPADCGSQLHFFGTETWDVISNYDVDTPSNGELLFKLYNFQSDFETQVRYFELIVDPDDTIGFCVQSAFDGHFEVGAELFSIRVRKSCPSCDYAVVSGSSYINGFYASATDSTPPLSDFIFDSRQTIAEAVAAQTVLGYLNDGLGAQSGTTMQVAMTRSDGTVQVLTEGVELPPLDERAVLDFLVDASLAGLSIAIDSEAQQVHIHKDHARRRESVRFLNRFRRENRELTEAALDLLGLSWGDLIGCRDLTFPIPATALSRLEIREIQP